MGLLFLTRSQRLVDEAEGINGMSRGAGQDGSIWAVTPRIKTTYFYVFFTFLVAGLALAGVLEYQHGVDKERSDTAIILALMGRAGSITIGAAALAMLTSEIWGWLMVLADRYMQRRMERAHKEGRAQAKREIVDAVRSVINQARQSGEQDSPLLRYFEALANQLEEDLSA